jgi:hypothetical protein
MTKNLPATDADLTDIDEKSDGGVRLPSAKVRAALELMVWQGAHRDDAAKAAGLRPKSLYHALQKAHCKAWYLGQLDVLRTSGRARRFHRLEQLAEQDDNRMAAVAAIRLAEGQVESGTTRGNMLPSVPGLIVQIVDQRPLQIEPKTITITPAKAE